MKITIANPSTGSIITYKIDDEMKLQFLFDKRLREVVDAEPLGEQWKGYLLKITGGCDKEGFPCKNGVLTTKRVRLLIARSSAGLGARFKGIRKRKSVRGCIIGVHNSVVYLKVVKRGPAEIDGLTNEHIPRSTAPKRVGKIIKAFNLTLDDDPRDYLIRRIEKSKKGTVFEKYPKIQRLVTPTLLAKRELKKRRKSERKKNSYLKREAYRQMLVEKSSEIVVAQQRLRKRMLKMVQDKKKELLYKKRLAERRKVIKPDLVPPIKRPYFPKRKNKQTRAVKVKLERFKAWEEAKKNMTPEQAKKILEQKKAKSQKAADVEKKRKEQDEAKQ